MQNDQRKPAFDLTRHDLEALELALIRTKRKNWLLNALDLATLLGIAAGLFFISQVV